MSLEVRTYALALEEYWTLNLPAGAEVLNFSLEEGLPTIWVLCDANRPLAWRVFRLCRTGDRLDETAEALAYIGSARVRNGEDLVLHLFEVVN